MAPRTFADPLHKSKGGQIATPSDQGSFPCFCLLKYFTLVFGCRTIPIYYMYMYFILYSLTCLTRVFKQNSYLLACIIVGDFPNSRYLTYRFLLFGRHITFCSDNNCFLLLRQNYQSWNKEAPQCT